MKVAEQDEVVGVATTSVQGEPVNEPATVPVLVKATVPPGLVAPVAAVSVAVAVHVTACPITAGEGAQVTPVVVA